MFHGKMKAVTFSYDDGVTQDRQLLRIFEKYGLRATFNINSGLFGAAHAFYDKQKNRTFPHVCLRETEIAEVYAGHEVAVHTLTHPVLKDLSDEEILHEVEDDRRALSALVGYEVQGMAYPVGSSAVTPRVVDVIRRGTGVRYARTTTSTHSFDLPQDPLLLHPTARHGEKEKLLELAERFLALEPTTPQLFYIWGHAYEFERDDDWEWFDAFCRRISGRPDIYYGTNRDILL
ncbi:MAG: polysaccharide deacetylase family protein [Clostridia bacterium]|nr:polysaccharide deacetylase family protein [Clostridia bacterium]